MFTMVFTATDAPTDTPTPLLPPPAPVKLRPPALARIFVLSAAVSESDPPLVMETLLARFSTVSLAINASTLRTMVFTEAAPAPDTPTLLLPAPATDPAPPTLRDQRVALDNAESFTAPADVMLEPSI